MGKKLWLALARKGPFACAYRSIHKLKGRRTLVARIAMVRLLPQRCHDDVTDNVLVCKIRNVQFYSRIVAGKLAHSSETVWINLLKPAQLPHA